ncbi:phage minor head protein [Methanobrevibacter sp.]|uniref:phage head morphogenesis protein n=1 Tax=Methanobrevibacter sp. TaxID=66852 RepID=UPI0025D722F7|nr:phage minor head protein [Methanobrevibacter sp.]
MNNEQALKYELTLFFQNLKKSVLSELEEFYSEEFMFQAHADLILAPIFEAQQEYYNILRKFNHKEYKFGRKTGRRLVKLARKKAKKGSLTYADKASKTPSILNATIKKDELFDTNPWSEQKLLNQTFTASERTMNRIDSDINKILSDGYRNGKGINVVRNDITKRFDQLSSWESTRIARTEIHNAHNMGTMDIYQEMGVEYTQWIAAHDSRTRTSHLDVDREIIPMGGTYSNDLRYPGDTSGPLKEWINCRCSNAPFVIPDGYIAPSFAPFKEEDLIPTLDYWNPPRLLENDYAHEYSLANTPISNDPKFKALKTHEEIADYFGYEYREKGLYYEEAGMRTFEFYDPKHDTILRFAKDKYNKCNYIDFTNSKSYNEFNGYRLKDILRIYDESHPNLKVGVDDIEFYKGYSNSPRGFADNFKVEIFDNGLKRSGGQPFDWVLDHELSHLFDDTFLSGIEKAKYNKVASILEKHLDDAKKLDNKYLNSKNIEEQLTIYSSKNTSEEFAELMAATSNLKRGNNFKLRSETKLTLQEAKGPHQHKFKFAEELLEHPEKFKTNWKVNAQQKVKNHREDIENFYKKTNPSGKIRALQSVEGYDKYALTEAENVRLKELTIKKEKEGGLKFHDRMEFEELADRKEFNELRNKVLLEGGDPTDIFAFDEIDPSRSIRYERLVKQFRDWVPKGNIEIKPIKINKKGLSTNKNAFKLTADEKKVYKQLKQNNAGLSSDEKLYKNELNDKIKLNQYHKELSDGKLEPRHNEEYIRLYNKHKDEWDLPELTTDLKFQIEEPSYRSDEYYKSIKKYGLTKKESDEWIYLNKKELIGEKLSSKELKRIEFLESKDRFAF